MLLAAKVCHFVLRVNMKEDQTIRLVSLILEKKTIKRRYNQNQHKQQNYELDQWEKYTPYKNKYAGYLYQNSTCDF